MEPGSPESCEVVVLPRWTSVPLWKTNRLPNFTSPTQPARCATVRTSCAMPLRRLQSLERRSSSAWPVFWRWPPSVSTAADHHTGSSTRDRWLTLSCAVTFCRIYNTELWSSGQYFPLFDHIALLSFHIIMIDSDIQHVSAYAKKNCGASSRLPGCPSSRISTCSLFVLALFDDEIWSWTLAWWRLVKKE